MQPRILVKEEGQAQKKRFISPTEIKNNQINFGDPLGSAKYHSPPTNRVQSPNNSNQIRLSRQNNEKFPEQEVRRMNENSKKIDSKAISREDVNRQSKSKSGKKDYMMASLARFNKKQDSEVEGRSRSKNKFDKRTEKNGNHTQNQYAAGNIYSQKQKVASKKQYTEGSVSGQSLETDQFRESNQSSFLLQNSDSERQYSQIQPNLEQNRREPMEMGRPKNHSQNESMKGQKLAFSKNDFPKFANGTSSPNEYESSHQNYRDVHLEQPERFQQRKNLTVQSTESYERENSPHRHSTENEEKKEIKLTKVSKTQMNEPAISSIGTEGEVSQKVNKIQTIQDNFYRGEYLNPGQLSKKSIDQSRNTSTLNVHLERAHVEKEELREKKLILQKQRVSLQQTISRQQNMINQLKRQNELLNVEKMELNSKLKTHLQFEHKAEYELQGLNEKNQGVYREIHQKYDRLLNDYKSVINQRDKLASAQQKYSVDMKNMHTKLQEESAKGKHFERQLEQVYESHRANMKRNNEGWRARLEQVQSQLRDQQKANSTSSSSSLKIKLMEVEAELSHKTHLIEKRNEEIKNLKKELSHKSQFYEDLLNKKQMQLKQADQGSHQHQQNYQELSRKNIEALKRCQAQLAKVEQDLFIRTQEYQDLKIKCNSEKQNLVQQYLLKDLNGAELSDSSANQAAMEAKRSIEAHFESQTEELNKCRTEANRALEENIALKQQIEELRADLRNMEQDFSILKMQYSALEKKKTQSSSSEVVVIKNQQELSERKIKELENRVEWKTKEIVEKDKFIQNHLIGLTKEERIPELLEALKSVLNVKSR